MTHRRGRLRLRRLSSTWLTLAFVIAPTCTAQAAEELPAGHSQHGAAFNEGPRQAAYLMHGTGQVGFPVSTPMRLVQQFVQQGVGQLHGFWYYESERSFRQAAALDPECAMAYWGMAMSNVNNRKRARSFLKRSHKVKRPLTQRETLYLKSAETLFSNRHDKNKSARGKAYVKSLETLVKQFPDDYEAKAFLAAQVWRNTYNKVPLGSHVAVDALLQQVLTKHPEHPCHHYRIHLWDKEDPKLALRSAALCGPSAPAIAHMWHMPGHIYSRLHRYKDAAWQQEASARTDHAYMVRDWLMPDRIHNYAHNNEWLIRNQIKLGRIEDAYALARNMGSLPRHPKVNTLEKKGSSAAFGRTRLYDVLNAFEMWEELISLSQKATLTPGSTLPLKIEYHRQLGRAYALSDRFDEAQDALQILNGMASAAKDPGTSKDEPPSDAVAKQTDIKADQQGDCNEAGPSGKLSKEQRKTLDSAIGELTGLLAWRRGAAVAAKAHLKSLQKLPLGVRAQIYRELGQTEKATKMLDDAVRENPGEVLPLAHLAHHAWLQDDRDKAMQTMRSLQPLATDVAVKRIPFSRLAPIARALDWKDDWTPPPSTADDVGARPPLDSLGPIHWQPPIAPHWSLPDIQGTVHTDDRYAGKPVVVIFYLGFGCLHCVEQLQAFAPQAATFRDAGIEMVAIGTDDLEQLAQALENYGPKGLPIPILSDAALQTFRAFRCFDDFEEQPLHGTFFIDGDRRIRWQDIGHEPFLDHEFLLQEAIRLSSLTR